MDAPKVLAFHAPKDLQERVEALLEKKQESSLTSREQEELDYYFILEHIVRLAKSRARLRLTQAGTTPQYIPKNQYQSSSS